MLGHLGLGHLRILEHSGGLADIGLGHAGLSSTFPPPGPSGSQTGFLPENFSWKISSQLAFFRASSWRSGF